VWDDKGSPPEGEWNTLLWSSFEKTDDGGLISIPQLVEENSDELRTAYLSWIYELGMGKIDEQRIIDHLEIRPGFSFWWMTRLAEKSIYKSPRISDALRFLALEKILKEVQPSRIILVSPDQTIATTLESLCRNSTIQFEWRRLKRSGNRISISKRIIRSIPLPVQAFLYLFRYIAERWRLKKPTDSKADIFKARVSFFDYLIHLNKTAFKTGRFASNYWTDLVNILGQTCTGVNWFHIYVSHPDVKTTGEALELTDRFTANSEGTQVHRMLDGALSLSVVIRSISDYLYIVRKSIRIGGIRQYFKPANSNLDLWPLFKKDWFSSLYGTTAMWNCLVINLFERSINALPRQKQGFYLLENQGWEMALINAWRTAGHGELIGVVHSTVRYWDLRYFYDVRNYLRTEKNPLPMPDMVALNGPAAIKAYRQSDYPEIQMVEVEALRYLNIKESIEGADSKTTASSPSRLNILVCGDYLSDVTHQLMQWMEQASMKLPDYASYRVKPHPACPILPEDYPLLPMKMADASLFELFTDCDVVLTSNSTSACIDAYCASLPVIQILDSNTFNFSPLRGLKGVVYVTDPMELATAICNAAQHKTLVTEPYFCIDKRLPRWQKLMGIS